MPKPPRPEHEAEPYLAALARRFAEFMQCPLDLARQHVAAIAVSAQEIEAFPPAEEGDEGEESRPPARLP